MKAMAHFFLCLLFLGRNACYLTVWGKQALFQTTQVLV